MSEERIHHLRSYYAGPHGIDAVAFARSALVAQQTAVRRQLDVNGFAPAQMLPVLGVVIKDPRALDAKTVTAYVNGGNWLARCECGGVEFVDFDWPIFMCCSCWNKQSAGRWRQVELPTELTRSAVETILLARPVSKTRSWYPHEPIEKLVQENLEHQVDRGITDAQLVAAAGAQLVAPVPVQEVA